MSKKAKEEREGLEELDATIDLLRERAERRRSVGPADARVLEHYIEVRQRSITAIGEAVLAMSATERYRNHSIGNLRELLVEPLMRDRIALVTTRPPEGWTKPFLPHTAIAIWASVSEEVDRRIAEQSRAGVFPVLLEPEEWVSGNNVWLLDVLAPDPAMAGAVVGQFRKVANTNSIKLHPGVLKLLSAELLAELFGQARRSAPPVN